MKSVAIIGAGPAGLSAAYELLSRSNEYQVTIYEKDSSIGGLSKTFEFDGGRVDIGGHRFFSKNEEVLRLWEEVLPKGDQGMLLRDRESHILWNSKLISYPIQLNAETIGALGLAGGLKVVFSYLYSRCKDGSIESLEDFYVDRFGRELYSRFFEGYTRKLWGLPASEISADWGNQRVRKVSLGTLLGTAFWRGGDDRLKERSLIGRYQYPAFGCGQLWNELGNRVMELGGQIKTGCSVERLAMSGPRIEFIEYLEEGLLRREECDYVISSMPLGDLAGAVVGTPPDVKDVCSRLHYRDMLIVAVDLPRSFAGGALLKAQKDSWLYVQDATVGFGRCQILNNWSPLSAKRDDHILLELEYFCDKGDALWSSGDELIVEQTLTDLIRCGICGKDSVISSYLVERIEKAYPVYADGYCQLDVVRNWVNEVDNLLCVGRNGQHRYNNMDHSAETGMKAARVVLGKRQDREQLWGVNASKEYIEE